MSILVNNLTKTYGTQLALNEVSFSLSPGEIVGLLGPNGAGKSTCMKILSGYISNYTGEAIVAGHDVSNESQMARRKLGYLPEHNPLYLDMYVREYLGFIASVFQISNAQQRIRELIELAGLGDEQHKRIRSLSKGYRQRVGLAQAFLQDPEVLILDEPTSGLDPNQLVEIRELIRDLGKNKTVLFSSHILPEVQALCDRVLVLHHGDLVADQRLDASAVSGFRISVEYDRAIADRQLAMPHLIRQEWQSDHKVQLTFDSAEDPRAEVFDHAVAAGLRIISLVKEDESIVDLFAGLTKTKN